MASSTETRIDVETDKVSQRSRNTRTLVAVRRPSSLAGCVTLLSSVLLFIQIPLCLNFDKSPKWICWCMGASILLTLVVLYVSVIKGEKRRHMSRGTSLESSAREKQMRLSTRLPKTTLSSSTVDDSLDQSRFCSFFSNDYSNDISLLPSPYSTIATVSDISNQPRPIIR